MQDPGHPRLDIVLRDHPTELHFDPEHVEVLVISSNRDVEKISVSHPWTGSLDFHVFPGRVVLKDRLGKTARAFTFGGQLEVKPEETRTLCILQSSAPILSLTIERSMAVMLAEEIEILFAERQAARADHPHAFEERLAAIDPMLLYHAGIKSLRKRYQRFPITDAEGSVAQKFIHFLLVESQALDQIHRMPVQADSLEELL
jgi:hypothetical protein